MLVPGGAPEALNYDPSEVRLYLKRRKGFARLALEQGRPLVPVFAFGENFIYSRMPNPKGSKLRAVQVR